MAGMTKHPHPTASREAFFNRSAWARDLRILSSLSALFLVEYLLTPNFRVPTTQDRIRGPINLLIACAALYYYDRIDNRRHGERTVHATIAVLFLVSLTVHAVAGWLGAS